MKFPRSQKGLVGLAAQGIKRPTDDEIVSAIRDGEDTAQKLMLRFYNVTEFRWNDPDYKHLNKRLVSLRKFRIVKVKSEEGRKLIYCVGKD